MKRLISIIISSLLLTQLIAQQSAYGYIRDQKTGEILIGASVYAQTNNTGVSSNIQGYYQITSKKKDTLQFSFVGYETQKRVFDATSDTLINVALEQKNELSEVEVIASRPQASFNTIRLSPKEIEHIPSLTGKPDVMRSLQLLPGIQTTNEGSGNLLVRGGDAGQNLYLLDNVPLIYVHHLGGFMSVFNPDMINSVDIYKGGFPARYGNKLSSIVDIAQREGNHTEKLSSLSVGFTDIAYSSEGPLEKWKNASYMITGRKTFTEPYLYLATGLDRGSSYHMTYGFHDINAKLSWQKDAMNQFYFNLYQGDDYLRYKGHDHGKHLYKNVWGNWMLSSRWHHLFNSGLLSTTTLSANRYRLKELTRQQTLDTQERSTRLYRSIVSNMRLQSDWNISLSSYWHLNYGVQSNTWLFKPNKFSDGEYAISDHRQTIQYTNVLYMEHSIKLRSWSTLKLGARLQQLACNDTHSTTLLPRLQTTFHLPYSQQINLSYMEVNQNSHLLFTPGDIMQNEIWVPADGDVPVAQSQQVTIGWRSPMCGKQYQIEIDAYQKRLTNLIAYKEGYTFMSGDVNWKTKLENKGQGQARGLELMCRKTTGRTTGFISYAYAKTQRQFDNINQGKTYVFEYDRPHVASISIHHQLSKKTSINALWVYQTGLPYTPAIGRRYTASVDGEATRYYEALVYGERNSARMADYHRLDLSLCHEKRSKRNNRCIWTFSLYNAYARQNPHHYYYSPTAQNDEYKPEMGYSNLGLKMYQISYLPIIPSISYKVFFDESSKAKRKTYRQIKQKGTPDGGS